MAEPYLERLSQIVGQLKPVSAGPVTLEAKHFFSGAALYANGRICGLLSPVGLAIKLPAKVRHRLLDEGKGTRFRFFPKGPIKREYITLPASIVEDDRHLQKLLAESIRYVVGEAGESAA